MSQIIATQRDLLPQFVPPRGFVPVHPGEHGGRAHWNDILRKAVQRCLPTAAKSSADELPEAPLNDSEHAHRWLMPAGDDATGLLALLDRNVRQHLELKAAVERCETPGEYADQLLALRTSEEFAMRLDDHIRAHWPRVLILVGDRMFRTTELHMRRFHDSIFPSLLRSQDGGVLMVDGDPSLFPFMLAYVHGYPWALHWDRDMSPRLMAAARALGLHGIVHQLGEVMPWQWRY